MKKKKEKKQRHIFKNIMMTLVVLMGIFMIGCGFVFYDIIKETPKISTSRLENMNTTKIYDKNDKLIYSTGFNSRDYVTYDKIPKLYKDALISTEDRTFFENSGINLKSTLLAVAGKLSGGRITERGGSTLTQQLVKLSFYSTKEEDKTIKRKIQEIWLALQITKIYSKDKILEFYVNKIYEGNNVYGAQTISKLYYNKPLDKLNLAQTAFIAGIGQSPSVYNLYLNPKKCESRRREVLLSMYNNKKITKKQFDEANKTPITYGLIPKEQAQKKNSKRVKTAEYYIESTLAELRKLGYKPETQDLKVYTEYDESKQQKLTSMINQNSNYTRLGLDGIQAAATLVNVNNGKVIAQTGGRNSKTLFGLNRASQMNRSTGSTTKPLLDYAPGIENFNWATNKIFQDTPYIYKGTNIQLYDYDHLYRGAITMRTAINDSRNVPAVRALEETGSSLTKKFLSKIDCDVKDYYGGSDALGLDLSTQRVARAYSAFANGGEFYKTGYVKKIEKENGQVVNYNKSEKVMKSATAYEIISLMSSVMYANDGSGKRYRPEGIKNIAGKTGTVELADKVGASDVWMSGFTSPDKESNSGLSLSVWCGYDEPNKPGHNLNDKQQELAGWIWKDIMSEMCKGQKNPSFEVPKDIQFLTSNENINTCDIKPISRTLEQPRTKLIDEKQAKEEKYWSQKNNAKVKVEKTKEETEEEKLLEDSSSDSSMEGSDSNG